MGTELRLYDTLSGELRRFEPVTAGQVKIYLCGPTVYRPSHIGHAVGPVIFDALKRYLKYLGYQVTLVVNVTDVDDKLIAEACRLGCQINDLAQRITADYLKGLEALNVSMPDHMPRATEYIQEIIDLIKTLEQKGYAYPIDGDVYFEVARDPDYGKLSGRKIDQQQAGSRELHCAQGKRGPGDFVLWKSAKPQEPAWDSPWGSGRPGWHIECSAMSMKLLGPTFDIHGGGIDLIFPHHENEIAQSQCATGKPFVKYWMHNGLTRINTKKMSKSAGHIRTIAELIQQYPGEVIRFFILSTHYRRPIDFSDEAIEAVVKGIQTFYRLFERIGRLTSRSVFEPIQTPPDIQAALSDEANDHSKALADDLQGHQQAFFDALADDFNTASAIGSLYELASLLHKFIDDQNLETQPNEELLGLLSCGCDVLRYQGGILGVFEKPPQQEELGDQLASKVELLIKMRKEARTAKNYQLADQVRDQLSQLGVVLEDTPSGTTWRVERT